MSSHKTQAELLPATPQGLGQAVLYLAFEPDDQGNVEPPTERLLFAYGDNPTSKGVFRFTDRSALSVLDFWTQWTGGQKGKGRADYEHEMARPHTVAGPQLWASAAFDVEVRDASDKGPGGCWATGIEWLDPAPDLIRSRRKDGTSPWFTFDKDTGEILSIINFGLVCLPATFGQRPLAIAASHTAEAMPILAPPDRQTAVRWHTEGLLSAVGRLMPLHTHEFLKRFR